MKITDEAVEAAARAITARYGDPARRWKQDVDDARVALEAAAPHIIATALREAADELEYGNPVGQWLCDRADEMESPNGN